MNYHNGIKVELGDRVRLSKSLGTVVAIISENKYLEGYDSFEYLNKGILIKFNHYGLIYYSDEIEEDVEFILRK
ncbi:hypothetical protein ACWIUA_11440 [Ursidibacter sp. B-7004-1]